MWFFSTVIFLRKVLCTKGHYKPQAGFTKSTLLKTRAKPIFRCGLLLWNSFYSLMNNPSMAFFSQHTRGVEDKAGFHFNILACQWGPSPQYSTNVPGVFFFTLTRDYWVTGHCQKSVSVTGATIDDGWARHKGGNSVDMRCLCCQ